MTVTTPAGFRAAGIAAGLKESGRPDLAVVINDGPEFGAAGVFTTNRVKAAPVQWSQQVLQTGSLRAILLNSGGANACTGPEGFADTHRSAELAAASLGIGAIDVAVCSTGLIGVRLPMSKLERAIPEVIKQASASGGPSAAEAIMTTDTVSKQAARSDESWTVGAMAKGAAMLAPGLATMLVVITTDAVMGPDTLHASLAEASRLTFDRLDSDGCMSTNDSVLLMASGASGIAPAQSDFQAALIEVCADLCQQLLHDAEGSAHDIAITVSGAAGEEEAVEVGRAIARNNLLKCAIFGNDPNWGRVLAAIGTTRATFDPSTIDVAFNAIPVCVAGSIGQPRELVDLSGRQVDIDVDLHAGNAAATIWTNDLTYDYVKENAEYAT